MANQTGIAITIKAFLPTGKTLDEQFAALSIVKAAHETGDYSALLKAAGVEDVKTEQKTRRIEDQPQTTADNSQGTSTEGEQGQGTAGDAGALAAEGDEGKPAGREVPETETKPDPDADVPEFLKKEKKAKAA